MANEQTQLLELTDISKTFPGVKALDGVAFSLRRGEVHALVGENGAGKSTLIKIVTGVLQPDAGAHIAIGGETVAHNSPETAQALGVAAIYQHPTLFPELSVMENLMLGRDGAIINWRKRRKLAAECLEHVGADILLDAPVKNLRMAEKQLLEMARALGGVWEFGGMGAWGNIDQRREMGDGPAGITHTPTPPDPHTPGARILIMDEPTAALPKKDADHLLELIDELRGKGVGIVYISHRLEEVLHIADRMTILRDGRLVGEYAAGELDRAGIIRAMAGRALEGIYTRGAASPEPAGSDGSDRSIGSDRSVRSPASGPPSSAEVLSVDGLSCRAGGIFNISFTLHAGEILGVAGLVGAGRTELARALFGITPADRGTIRLRGRTLSIRSPQEAIAQGIAYVPEDRHLHGVIQDLPVADNVTLPILRQLCRGGLVQRDRAEDVAGDYAHKLRVKAPSIYTLVRNLSGGNQQKVALSRWMATRPKVLILDEPTQGIDVGAKAEIYALMEQLAGEGVAILMISSDLPEILGMSDRVAVMRQGELVATLDRREATQERILAFAMERSVAIQG